MSLQPMPEYQRPLWRIHRRVVDRDAADPLHRADQASCTHPSADRGQVAECRLEASREPADDEPAVSVGVRADHQTAHHQLEMRWTSLQWARSEEQGTRNRNDISARRLPTPDTVDELPVRRTRPIPRLPEHLPATICTMPDTLIGRAAHPDPF